MSVEKQLIIKVDINQKEIREFIDQEIEKFKEPGPQLSCSQMILLGNFYRGNIPDIGFDIETIDQDTERLITFGYIDGLGGSTAPSCLSITTKGTDRIRRMLGYGRRSL